MQNNTKIIWYTIFISRFTKWVNCDFNFSVCSNKYFVCVFVTWSILFTTNNFHPKHKLVWICVVPIKVVHLYRRHSPHVAKIILNVTIDSCSNFWPQRKYGFKIIMITVMVLAFLLAIVGQKNRLIQQHSTLY